jgi:uncharacterized protein
MKPRFALLLLLLGGLTAQAQSLLWEISGNGLRQPSYLFGTYHVLKDSYLSQNLRAKTAFLQANGVVVETVIDSSAMLQMALRAMMLDKSLPKLLPSADYKLVADEFKRATGYDIMLFNQMKPIVTATMLAMAYIESENDTLQTFSGQPLDLYFAAEGKRAGKTVVSLETMEQQMGFLYDHDPVEKQATDLVTMVRQKDEMLTSGKKITALYLRGDLAAMWKLSQDYEQKFGDMAYLVKERNANWMKQLPAQMALRPTFIAVGALHLPGPDGLLELLKKAGYTLKPL